MNNICPYYNGSFFLVRVSQLSEKAGDDIPRLYSKKVQRIGLSYTIKSLRSSERITKPFQRGISFTNLRSKTNIILM